MSFAHGYFTKAHNAPAKLVEAEKRCFEKFDEAHAELCPIDKASCAASYEGEWILARLIYPGILYVKIFDAPKSTQHMMEDVSKVMIMGGWVGMYSLIVDLTDPPASLDVQIMKDLVPFIRERRMWSRMQLQSMSFVLSSRNPGFSGLATSVLKTVFNFMHLPSAPLTILCGKRLYEGENVRKADARALNAAVCTALSSPLNGFRVPVLLFPRSPDERRRRQQLLLAGRFAGRKSISTLTLSCATKGKDEGGGEWTEDDFNFSTVKLLCTSIIAYLGTKLFPIPSPPSMQT